jgi:hypothetical protein
MLRRVDITDGAVRHIFQATSPVQRIAAGICSLMLAGCGGGNGGGSMSSPNPISVFLPISTVTVSQSGMQVTVPIQIASTSETALVMVGGLPSGVQERYAASDTNPSGTLARP